MASSALCPGKCAPKGARTQERDSGSSPAAGNSNDLVGDFHVPYIYRRVYSMNFDKRDPSEADESPLRSDKFKADTDGSVTIYIQAASPGKDAKTKNVVTPESRKQPEDGEKPLSAQSGKQQIGWADFWSLSPI
jgi:hypothetical protein